MDKTLLYQQILDHFEAVVKRCREASLDAAQYATDSESKAESKWDTQGIEASYLAAGQAQRFQSALDVYNHLKSELMETSSKFLIEPGALFKLKSNGTEDAFLFTTCGEGISVATDEGEVTLITPQTPLGKRILNKTVGAKIAMPDQTVWEVTYVG